MYRGLNRENQALNKKNAKVNAPDPLKHVDPLRFKRPEFECMRPTHRNTHIALG